MIYCQFHAAEPLPPSGTAGGHSPEWASLRHLFCQCVRWSWHTDTLQHHAGSPGHTPWGTYNAWCLQTTMGSWMARLKEIDHKPNQHSLNLPAMKKRLGAITHSYYTGFKIGYQVIKCWEDSTTSYTGRCGLYMCVSVCIVWVLAQSELNELESWLHQVRMTVCSHYERSTVMMRHLVII